MKNFNDQKSTTPVFTSNEEFLKTIYSDIRLNSNNTFLSTFLRGDNKYGQGIKAITLGFTKPLDFTQTDGAYEFKTIEPENEQAIIKGNHKSKYMVSWSDADNEKFRDEEEKQRFYAIKLKTAEDLHTLSLKRAIQYIFGAAEEEGTFAPNLKTLLDEVKNSFEAGKSIDTTNAELLTTIRKVSFDLTNESKENTFSKTKTNYSYVPLDEQIMVMSHATYDKLQKIPTTQLPEKYSLPLNPIILPNIPDNKIYIGDKRVINIYTKLHNVYTDFNPGTLLHNLILHAWDWIGIFDIYAGKIIKITD